MTTNSLLCFTLCRQQSLNHGHTQLFEQEFNRLTHPEVHVLIRLHLTLRIVYQGTPASLGMEIEQYLHKNI